MLVVAQTDRWDTLIRKRLGREYQYSLIQPSELTVDVIRKSRVVLLEFQPECFDRWLSLFDKTGRSLENSISAVLGGPLDRNQKSWCRELGFHDFVENLESLNEFLGRWKNWITPVPGFESLKQEILQQIALPNARRLQ